MATIYKETRLDVPVDELWAALSDVRNVDRLLSYVTNVELDDNVRSCALDGGGVLKELIISNDDERRRLAYSVVEEPFGFDHHSASWVAKADGDGSVFVWETDVLPDSVVGELEPLIDKTIDDIRSAIGTATVVTEGSVR